MSAYKVVLPSPVRLRTSFSLRMRMMNSNVWDIGFHWGIRNWYLTSPTFRECGGYVWLLVKSKFEPMKILGISGVNRKSSVIWIGWGACWLAVGAGRPVIGTGNTDSAPDVHRHLISIYYPFPWCMRYAIPATFAEIAIVATIATIKNPRSRHLMTLERKVLQAWLGSEILQAPEQALLGSLLLWIWRREFHWEMLPLFGSNHFWMDQEEN